MADRKSINIQIKLDGKEQARKEVNNIISELNKTSKLTPEIQLDAKLLNNFQKTFDKTINNFMGSIGIKAGTKLGDSFSESLKTSFKSSDIEKMIKATQEAYDKQDIINSKKNNKKNTEDIIKPYKDVFDYVNGQSVTLKNINLDESAKKDFKDSVRKVMKVDKDVNATPIDNILQQVEEIGKQWGLAFNSDVVEDRIKELSNWINEYRSLKKNGVGTQGMTSEEEYTNTARLVDKSVELYDTLEKLEKQKLTGGNPQTLEKEKQTIEEIAKTRQNIVNKSGDSGDVKSYDALLARAEKIQNTMQGISKIDMSVKNGDDGIEKLNKAVITYKNNLNQTVIETMKLKDITDSEGKVIGQEFKLSPNVKITDNTEQQAKAQEKAKAKQEKYDAEALALYEKDELAKTQALQNEIAKRTKLEQDAVDKYSKTLNDSERANEQAQAKASVDLGNKKDKMQLGVNKLQANDFLDESVIKDVQNRLNSINTNSSEEEVKQLAQEIKNLGSSDSQIVRVQNNLSKMKSGLDSMQGKYKGLVGDKDSIAQLEKYNSEVKKLENLLSELQSGKTFTGEKISSELNQASEASRNLSNAVKNSSSALKLSQQDAQSFGNSIKKAFANAGMYTSVYEVIQLTSRAIKEGIQTVISMDSALMDLNKVVNLTKEQLNGMRDSAVSMGKEFGKSAIEVSNAQAEIGRMIKDTESINELTKTSIVGSNVMDGTTSGKVAKDLTTIMTSMKKEVGESMSILDSMNEIKCVSPYIVMCK